MIASALLSVFLVIPCSQDDSARQAAQEALEAFKTEFAKAGTNTDAKNAAVRNLGQIRHEATRNALTGLLTTDTDFTRIEAARALSSFQEIFGTARKVGPALHHGSNNKKTAVRVEIIRCLAALKNIEGLPAVHQAVRDRDLIVAKEAVVQIPVFLHKSSLPVLIDYLKDVEREPQPICIEVPVDQGDQLKELREKYGIPQWDFTLRITEDEFQKLRHEMLHEAILEALRKLTGKTALTTWRGWNNWWLTEGQSPSFKLPKA